VICFRIVGRDSDGLDGLGIGPQLGRYFRTCPDRPWGPPSHLYNGYRVISAGKVAGEWREKSTLSSTQVKERVQLYLPSTSVCSCTVL